MPTLNENNSVWEQSLFWESGGDNWSDRWGSVNMQWFSTVLSRIHAFIPAKTILEIGSGFGRFTHFLLHQCEKLYTIDLSRLCVDACKKRFASYPHVQCILNDGVDISMIPDASVDFVFSYDSLVHAERDVMQKYLKGISQKLTEQGVGFIHHSNLGEYALYVRMRTYLKKLSQAFHRKHLNGHPNASNQTMNKSVTEGDRLKILKKIGAMFGMIEIGNMRAPSMTAALFAQYAQESGLHCTTQELVTWEARDDGKCGKRMMDCFSVITHPGSRWDRAHSIFRNIKFHDETVHALCRSKLYSYPTSK